MKKKIWIVILILLVFIPLLSVDAATAKVFCGKVTNIPKKIPELTSYAITIIQVAVPIILVIVGMLDMFKGVTSQKEEEIKKGQQTFIKRLITAVLIFFIIVIVKFVVSVVDEVANADIVECMDCFLSNDCNK